MTSSAHPIIDRIFPKPSASIEPISQPESEPFWNALREGRFAGGFDSVGKLVQLDEAVGPWTDPAAIKWRELSGRGSIFSWVRYHRGYMGEFADILPYVVAVVELEEGGRLYARLMDCERDPKVGDRVSLTIERWPSGNCFPVFRLS